MNSKNLIFLRATKERLLKELEFLEGVCDRSSLQVLNNVLIRKKGEFISFTVTDIENQISVMTSFGIGDNDVAITCNFKMLFDSLNKLPDQDISIGLDEDVLFVVSGNINLRFQTISSDEFPVLIEYSKREELCAISSKEFLRLLKETHFAMASRDIRYYLNGSLLSFGIKDLISVSTNSHYLAHSALSINRIDSLSSERRLDLILTSKAILLLMKSLAVFNDDVKIELIHGYGPIIFCYRNIEFITKPIEGRFPDYQRAIPKVYSNQIRINRMRLLLAIQRTSIFLTEKFQGIRMSFTHTTLTIKATTANQDEFEEKIDLSFQGEYFEMGINANYLSKVLSNMDAEEIMLNISGNNLDNFVLSITFPNRDDFKSVIMPMRI